MNSNSSGGSMNFTFYPSHHCLGDWCTICHPTYTWTMPSLKPHCCPVCQGRTTMPAVFYDPALEGSAAGAGRVPCRACIAGVVWGA
jgi:hypothetical protein